MSSDLTLSLRPYLSNSPNNNDGEQHRGDVSQWTHIYQPDRHAQNGPPGEGLRMPRYHLERNQNITNWPGLLSWKWRFLIGLLLVVVGYISTIAALVIVVQNTTRNTPMNGGPQIWLAGSTVAFLLGILISTSVACDLGGDRAFAAYDQSVRDQWSSGQASQFTTPAHPSRNAEVTAAAQTHGEHGAAPGMPRTAVANQRDSEETRWSMFYKGHVALGEANTVPGDIPRGSVPGAQGADAGPAPRHSMSMEDTDEDDIGRIGSTACSSVRICRPVSIASHNASISYAPSSSSERPVQISPPPDRMHRRVSSTPSLNSIERARRFARRHTSVTSTSSFSPHWPDSVPEESYDSQGIEMQDLTTSQTSRERNQVVTSRTRNPIPALWNVHNYEMSRTNVRRAAPESEASIQRDYNTGPQDQVVTPANHEWNQEGEWKVQSLQGSRKLA
ncbi:hypothetical protein F5884DRAFT_834120 [Xylogone sp. PMI_703]|nr:hypothetical protein F5884DRAFT_834120 [Xylogone sp. PMI_703]